MQLRAGILAALLIACDSYSYSAGVTKPLTGPALVFEENLGQAPQGARFLARQGSMLFGIEKAAFVLSAANGDWVRFSFSGASEIATVRGEGALQGTRNYFVGSDPRRWATNVRMWERVTIDDLYPGINLVFCFNGRELEYDFVIEPDAHPDVIIMLAEGTICLERDDEDLVGSTERGVLFKHSAPRSFQSGAAVSSAWHLRENEVRILLGPYDRGAALIIDPVIVTSTYIGGSSGDRAHALALDESGNIYIGGETYSTNYPVQGAVQTVNKTPTQRDGFVTKLDPTGRTVIYSTYFGGNGYDIVEALAVDAAGALYFAGSGYSLDLPVSPTAFQKQANPFSGEDGFLVKLTPAGNAIAYCTYLAANSSRPSFETLRGIAIDSSGHAYIVGDTTDPTWPVTAGAYRTTGCGGTDPFVTKVSPDGSTLVYSTYICGSDFDLGNDIRIDSSGNAFVAGTTSSADFPQVGTPAVAIRANDGWVAKLNPSGTTLLRSTLIGGSSSDTAVSLALGSGGAIYIAGITRSADFPAIDGHQQTYRGSSGSCQAGLCGDSYVARLAPEFTLLSATYVGGARSDDRIQAVAASGTSLIAVGTTESSDFPLFGATQTTYAGGIDAFVSIFDPSLRNLSFSTFIGGSGRDEAQAVGIGTDGGISVAGYTLSTNFPTVNAYRSTSAGDSDAFVVKFSASAQASPRRRAVRH